MDNTTAIFNSKYIKTHLSVGCIVCGESVILDEREVSMLEYGLPIHSKVCDKCRAAILHMREQME